MVRNLFLVILLTVVATACAAQPTAQARVSVNPDKYIGQTVTITSYDGDTVNFTTDGRQFSAKAKDIRIDQPDAVILDQYAYALSANYLPNDFEGEMVVRLKDVVSSKSTIYALEGGEIVLITERILH